MPDDYESAAVRHFEDASSLQSAGRYDNAGHLIGFAAECAIKFRIQTLKTGEDAPQVHLPDLLLAARKRFGVRSGYLGIYNLLKGNVFSTWNVNRRYRATGETSKAEFEEWMTLTKRLFGAAGVKAAK